MSKLRELTAWDKAIVVDRNIQLTLGCANFPLTRSKIAQIIVLAEVIEIIQQ